MKNKNYRGDGVRKPSFEARARMAKQASAEPRIDPKAARAASRKDGLPPIQALKKAEMVAEKKSAHAHAASASSKGIFLNEPQRQNYERSQNKPTHADIAGKHRDAAAAYREALDHAKAAQMPTSYLEKQIRIHERMAAVHADMDPAGTTWDESKHPRDERGQFT